QGRGQPLGGAHRQGPPGRRDRLCPGLRAGAAAPRRGGEPGAERRGRPRPQPRRDRRREHGDDPREALTLPARRCAGCGTLSLDRGRACPACGAAGGSDVTLSGRGRLLSWTVTRVAPARYEAEAPYAVGLLELAEGPRLTARLEGDPERLSAGEPVTLASIDELSGPIFRPASR